MHDRGDLFVLYLHFKIKNNTSTLLHLLLVVLLSLLSSTNQNNIQIVSMWA